MESLQVRAGLHAGAEDEQLSSWSRSKLPDGQEGEGRRAPPGNGWAIKDAQAPPVSGVKNYDFALDGWQSAVAVVGMNGNELGYGDLVVAGGHDEELAVVRQVHVEAVRDADRSIPEGQKQLADGVGELRPGEQACGLLPIQAAGFSWLRQWAY